MSADELLIAVELPIARYNSAHFFCEFARRHGDYGIVGLAAQIVLGGLVVLFKLNPYLVALHFFLTLVVLGDAIVLYCIADRARDDFLEVHLHVFEKMLR